jgi:serine/threonine protein kinase
LDLKPDNILLDKNMVPKLADFGMSKLFREEQTRVTQSPIGTIGYLPPEYLFGHVVSKKLDIFSLGVIITKIIAGPSGQTRSVEMPSHEFLHQVNDNWRNRLEATCTPQTLEANCIQVSMCTEIGLRCMDMDRKQRPTIMDIIDKLDITETIVQKVTEFKINL